AARCGVDPFGGIAGKQVGKIGHKHFLSSWPVSVSRTRCGILHAAPQSRDRTKHRRSVRPRLCSAPLREELRAALRPGHKYFKLCLPLPLDRRGDMPSTTNQTPKETP